MNAVIEELDLLPRKTIRRIGRNPVKSATTVNLVYVNDRTPGITRMRKGSSFYFVLGSSRLKDKVQLARIKSLAIPPAWEKVWICKHENGHLQVTGFDALNRKQYRYHPLWNRLRNHTKYFRLHAFGEVLPALRLQVEKDLSLPGMPQDKVLAVIVCLMEQTTMRVGSASYEKLYGSFGLSTLKDKHVSISGSNLKFIFRGKKGVQHNIGLKNKRLAAMVKQCKDLPGRELFQYIDESGHPQSVDSGMVNEYIRKNTGSDYTSKDFRTWAGTVHALIALRESGMAATVAESKRKVVEALDAVAEHLGNTRNVCRKYYVHPVIITLYEKNTLNNYFEEPDKPETDDGKSGLTPEEKVLMKILEKEHY